MALRKIEKLTCCSLDRSVALHCIDLDTCFSAHQFCKLLLRARESLLCFGDGGWKRVIRGGSWKSSPDACRPTARQGEMTGDSDACFSTDYCGFRCVRRVTAEELEQMKGKVR